MPSTAWTIPSSVVNSTVRSRIEMIGSGTDPLGRVERVAESVADEVDAEHDQDDEQTGKEGQPPRLRVGLSTGDEHTERRRRRLDPEAEERECRLDQNRLSDRQRAVDDDRPERVR